MLPAESDCNEQRTAAASGCMQTVTVTNSEQQQLQAAAVTDFNNQRTAATSGYLQTLALTKSEQQQHHAACRQ